MVLLVTSLFAPRFFTQTLDYADAPTIFADLIVTMVCEPLVVGIVAKKTFFNDCVSNLRLVYVVSSNFSFPASVSHLAAISVDRFLAVIGPYCPSPSRSHNEKLWLEGHADSCLGCINSVCISSCAFPQRNKLCGCRGVYQKLFPHHRMLLVHHDFGIFAQEEKETARHRRKAEH